MRKEVEPHRGGEDSRLAMRVAALERGRRRILLVMSFLVGLFGSLAVAAVAYVLTFERNPSPSRVDSFEAGVITADRIVLRDALRLVDEKGRELVFVGRDTFGQGDALTVLGLSSPGTEGDEPQQTVRLAASRTGAAVSIRTPENESAASLFASQTGPRVEVRNRGETQVLSDIAVGVGGPAEPEPRKHKEPPPVAVRERPPQPLASVGAGPAMLVDLTRPESQDIGAGFRVSRLSLVTAGSGVRVWGRVTNAGEVEQPGARFEIEMAGRKSTFAVSALASGETQPFRVEIPGVPEQAAAEARIRFLPPVASRAKP